MADWVTASVEGFDLLTVTTMVEACEPDLTMVRYYDLRSSWSDVPPVWGDGPRGDLLEVAPAAPKVTCLQCAMGTFQKLNKADPRASLIEAARAGRVVVLDIRLRHDGEVCRRCQASLSPMGTTAWDGSIVEARQK